MSITETQLGIVISNNLGASLEDRYEGEMKTTFELSGAAVALKLAAKKVPVDLSAHADRAFEKGEIKDLEAAEVVSIIKKYLARVGDFLEHLGEVEQQKAVAQGGRAAGMKDALAMVQKFRDGESAKLQRMIEAAKQISEDDVVTSSPRTSGEMARAEHGTVADRRAAEGKEERETVAERRAAEQEKSEQPVKPKRKSRKSKA